MERRTGNLPARESSSPGCLPSMASPRSAEFETKAWRPLRGEVRGCGARRAALKFAATRKLVARMLTIDGEPKKRGIRDEGVATLQCGGEGLRRALAACLQKSAHETYGAAPGRAT